MLSSHIILKTFDLVIHQNPPTLHQTWLLNHCLGLLKKLSGFAGFAFYNAEFWHKKGKIEFPYLTWLKVSTTWDNISKWMKSGWHWNWSKVGQNWTKRQGSEVTVFENHSKCRIFNFQILAFSSNLCPIKSNQWPVW